MATRDWLAIKTEYVTGEISLRDLAKKHNVPERTIYNQCDAERWVDGRVAYRSKMADQTLAEAERRELTARLMAGEATALAFEDFRALPPEERGKRFPELLRQWAAMTGETTERQAVDATLRDWRAGLTPQQIAVIEQAAKVARETMPTAAP